jgi:thiol-disulfide isomerase/thioredoxin
MKPTPAIFVLFAATACVFLCSSARAEDKAENRAPASGEASATSAAAELLKIPLEDIERAYQGTTPPESVRMLLAISRGSQMGPGEGWFGPAQSRYSWQWLAERNGVSASDAIPLDKFVGSKAWFDRLDRNKDGRIAEDDLDWSDRNPWVQQSYLVNRLFRRIDPQGDGQVSAEEWQQFFQQAAKGKGHFEFEDLRDALLSGTSGGFQPGDGPSKEVLIRGLFAGEIGSLQEGPKLNGQAPDFSLKTFDGKQTVHLADVLGTKPVVLTFGNFTCGPFRSMFPGVEEVHERFRDEAVFLAVYVREAHPTDGWAMKSNEKAGVAVVQPKTYAERAAVATQCHELLKPTMPLLVDEINDPTGNAYSGMPARLYVIDRTGKVAYKRGTRPVRIQIGRNGTGAHHGVAGTGNFSEDGRRSTITGRRTSGWAEAKCLRPANYRCGKAIRGL